MIDPYSAPQSEFVRLSYLAYHEMPTLKMVECPTAVLPGLHILSFSGAGYQVGDELRSVASFLLKNLHLSVAQQLQQDRHAALLFSDLLVSLFSSGGNLVSPRFMRGLVLSGNASPNAPVADLPTRRYALYCVSLALALAICRGERWGTRAGRDMDYRAETQAARMLEFLFAKANSPVPADYAGYSARNGLEAELERDPDAQQLLPPPALHQPNPALPGAIPPLTLKSAPNRPGVIGTLASWIWHDGSHRRTPLQSPDAPQPTMDAESTT